MAERWLRGALFRGVAFCLCLAALPAWAKAPAAEGDPAGTCEKSVSWNDDPPFSQRKPNGAIGGLNVELIEAVLTRMGCRARWVEMPFVRALSELEAGRLDILPGAFQRPEREVYAHFVTDPFISRNLLFVRSETRDLLRLKSLLELRGSEFRLGLQIGVSYGPDYEELMKDAAFVRRTQRSSSRRGLWSMLKAGRVDGVIADELSGHFELQQMGLQADIRPTSISVSEVPAATAFSRKSNDLAFVERYERTVKGMQKDGTLRAILRRYRLAD